MKPVALLSLGGSLIVPGDRIDTAYLKKFSAWINRNAKKWRFIIVTGGGRTCRVYNDAAVAAGVKSHKDLDWMGIYSTRLNAQLFRSVLGPRLAEEEIIAEQSGKIAWRKPVLVGAGYKPGNSSDYAAVRAAQLYGIKKIFNLTNVDFVYDKDPRKFRAAVPVKKITWKGLLEIMGSKWIPGRNFPFDQAAAKLAQRSAMEVAILNGRNFKNLQKALEGKDFIGTKIS
jgi:uridylate kinase